MINKTKKRILPPTFVGETSRYYNLADFRSFPNSEAYKVERTNSKQIQLFQYMFNLYFCICNKCINKKMRMKNDTIAKLPKRNNQLSVKTSTVNNSPSLGTMTRNCVNFVDA